MNEPEKGNLVLKVSLWVICALIIVAGIVLIWGNWIWVG